MDTDVVDQPDRNRFAVTENGLDAELTYRSQGGRLVLLHTEVPDDFRGRGIGGQLVQAAVERARRTNETLVPRCSYARKYLEDHPEATDVTVDWGG